MKLWPKSASTTTKPFEFIMHLPDREKRMEFVRFCIVGVVASALHYGVYWLVQLWATSQLWLSLAYTIGYVASLIANFFLTAYFTFRTNPSARRAAGFGLSHAVNYAIHISLFNVFVHIGIHRLIAPLLVLAVAVPVNFLLLRWVFKK